MNLDWLEWILPALLAVTLAVGGTAAGWAGCLLWQRRRELSALRELVTQLHLKRALAADGPGTVDPVHDPVRCRSAVADVRGQVREALAELRPGSVKVAAVLVEMEAACARYLQEVSAAPGSYAARLSGLRLELHAGLRRLCGLREDLEYLAPGQRGDARAAEREAAAARVAEQLARRRAAADAGTGRTGRADSAADPGSTRMEPVAAAAGAGGAARTGETTSHTRPGQGKVPGQPRHRAPVAPGPARRGLIGRRRREDRAKADDAARWLPQTPVSAATAAHTGAEGKVKQPTAAAPAVVVPAAPVTVAAPAVTETALMPPPVPVAAVPAPSPPAVRGGKSSINKAARNRRRQKV